MLITGVILAGTAAGGEGEGGAEEQNAAAAAEDADNSNTNAGDKPSSTSGKSQHDDAATDKTCRGSVYLVSRVRNSVFRASLTYSGSLGF